MVWSTRDLGDVGVNNRNGVRGRSKIGRTRQSRFQPAIERLETRCLLDCTGTALVERTYDGTCNNLTNPDWGSNNVALLRNAPAAYADGISAPVVGNPPRPSPRVISNLIVDQRYDTLFDPRNLSAMVYAFGQFIDHDLDLTKSATPSEPFNIPVPQCDPYFDPECTGTKVIYLNRSKTVPGTGDDDPRQQPNLISAFLDGSVIYGSDAATATKLRTLDGGRLKTSPGNFLPYNNSRFFADCPPKTPCLPMDNDAHRVPDTRLFAAGDVRANENSDLTALHTLFVREHNYWAQRIQTENPSWTDEQIYQMARGIVVAELQVITYNEWLPTIFGANALAPWHGYRDDVNPGIANEFSTASFRMGHSMLGDDIEFLDNNGEEVAPEVLLKDAFFNPTIITANGIGPILKYLASDPSQIIDTRVINGLRNFLFGEPGQGGFDLPSLNMQRGRDHGLADYNSAREAYGLPRVTNFAEITSDVVLQGRLQTLYSNVDNIDLWIGGLAEDHVPGCSTGPLLREVVLDQFRRIRDGDRFWYQRVFSGTLLAELESTTLKTILIRNTEMSNLQDDVFVFKLTIVGTVFHDVNSNGQREPGEPGLPGRSVWLINDETGLKVSETVTDANGRYDFDNLTDIFKLGSYRVQQILPSGWIQTTEDPEVLEFTRGMGFVGITFGSDEVGRGFDGHLGTALDNFSTPESGSNGVATVVSAPSESPPMPAQDLSATDVGAEPASSADSAGSYSWTAEMADTLLDLDAWDAWNHSSLEVAPIGPVNTSRRLVRV